MKLQLQLWKILKKHGRMLAQEVLEEVVVEEQTHHDMLGCLDCYVDPHNSHISYCPLSVYNPFHPSHMCLAGVPCSCDRYLVDSEMYY